MRVGDVGVGVGRVARWWGWGWREVGEVLVWEGERGRSWRGGEMVGGVEGELERAGSGVEKGCSRQQGRIRLLRARRPWGVLLIGMGRVVGEQGFALELERVRTEFVERMPGRVAGRNCCCTPLLS